LGVAKTVAAILALIQAPISWAAIRLEYEFRCYLVTDRSLRIREGLATIREITLSFANVQQISVEQGPIQRLLGLSDVVVTSAGGGSAPSKGSHGSGARGDSNHVARFRDVENAEEIRGLVIARLRSLKDAGLGDSDDRHPGMVSLGIEGDLGSARLAAAQKVLAECRSLRLVLFNDRPVSQSGK
jgi:membrane protein YdbS with pleckstrin-like domain